MVEFSKVGDNRLDGVLAAMIVGILALVVVSFVVFMVGTGGGWLSPDSAWTVLFAYIPYFGLPLALVLMLVLVIRVARRRMRESRDG